MLSACPLELGTSLCWNVWHALQRKDVQGCGNNRMHAIGTKLTMRSQVLDSLPVGLPQWAPTLPRTFLIKGTDAISSGCAFCDPMDNGCIC
jgi:hypothetical protein